MHIDSGMLRVGEMSKNQPAAKRRGGAPQKAPGGLNRALFIRANDELIGKLERLAKLRGAKAGVVLSMADVARSLIVEAIENESEK